MPIQDSDLLLIETTSGVSNKIEASKLKANLAANTYNNYKLLVNKPDYSSRFVYAQNMQASVGLTDYMLVERAGVSYKVNGQQIIDYFPSAPAGAAGPITDVEDGITSIVVTFTFVEQEGGKFASTSDYQKLIDGDINTEAESNDGKPSGGAPNTGKKLGYIQLDPPIPVNSYIKIYQRGNAGSRNCILNNQASTEKPNVPVVTTEGQTWTASELNVGELSVISMVSAIDAGNSFRMSALEVDGVIYKGTASSISVGTASGGGYYTTLTLAGDTNLDLFTPGDAIRMVDSDGDVASYTPVTSTIASVTTNNYVADSSLSGTVYSGTIANAFDGTDTPVAPKASSSITFTPSTAIPINSTLRIKANVSDNTSQQAGLWINDVQQNTLTLGFPRAGNASNAATIWTTIPNPPTTLSKLYWGQDAAWISVAGIEIDGQVLINSSTTLTFASPNQDLKFFNPGDVVQSSGVSNCTGIYVDGIIKSDGSEENFYVSAVRINGKILGNKDDSKTINLGPYTSNANGNTTRWHDGSSVSDGTAEFKGSDTHFRPAPGGKANLYWTTPIDIDTFEIQCTIGSGGKGKSVLIKNKDTNRLLFKTEPLEGSGLYWRSTQLAGDKIISTDTAANKMVVDGGSWTGSDGSSSGDAADRETKVTAPAKSGTGNFNEATGPVVDVSNSNQQWIDNTNRLGEAFFIKPASARTGLAILRAKAIAQAQAWATKMSYEEQSFVTYRGHYWVSLSDQPDSRPSGKSDDWIDLGPVPKG